MSEIWDRNNPRVPFETTGKWVRDAKGYNQWQPDPVQMHLKMLEFSTHNCEFAPLPNFQAQLQLVATTRGVTAATSWWRDIVTGVLYPVSFNSLADIVKRATIVNGLTDLQEWKAMKRGSNYCIGLV